MSIVQHDGRHLAFMHQLEFAASMPMLHHVHRQQVLIGTCPEVPTQPSHQGLRMQGQVTDMGAAARVRCLRLHAAACHARLTC